MSHTDDWSPLYWKMNDLLCCSSLYDEGILDWMQEATRILDDLVRASNGQEQDASDRKASEDK